MKYPAFLSESCSVGTSSRIGPNPSAPYQCGLRPVINTCRQGWQTATVTYARSNRIPSPANRSMFGVMPDIVQPVTPNDE